ncbi:MAG: prolyl oligopeptidase family serine peptidase [Oscillospiraceae bacterium]|nr:prolyl oligopeptidase family serine peptidase [Oscillospiraceae bacterium]
MKEIRYLSKSDNSMQPALILPAEGNEPRPLIVCLHTWSYGLEKYNEQFPKLAAERNWHLIYPLFRGPNWTPEACGSDLVVSDIASAVDYMKEHYAVDESRIYLLGGSGGGHASLLMAGRHPEIWTAVSAWCPISDIAAWYEQTHAKKADPAARGYDDHIVDACGGNPVTDPDAAAEAKHRSPLTWLDGAKGKVILDIGTGIHDGHTGSVPVSQAMQAFNAVAEPEDRFTAEEIAHITEKEDIPAHLRFEGEDPAYGAHKVLLRRVSGMVRLTVFEGSHDILPGPGFGFLENQIRNGGPVWYSGEYKSVACAELTK